MALDDVLAARANAARATARIECGALGEVTLEALSVRELEQLSRNPDADRAIFYAACRDLQRVGAQLLRVGRVYRPDQVTELVSGDEAAKAADAVKKLSGLRVEAERLETERSPAQGDKVSEVRPDDVQESGQSSAESAEAEEIRPDGVQQKVTEFNEFRQGFVQAAAAPEPVEAGDGQVSREFLTEKSDETANLNGKQVLWSETAQTPQNVVEMDKMDSGLRNIEPIAAEKQTVRKKKKSNRAHEIKSEVAETLHEITSDFPRGKQSTLHENESEVAETMHESTSEFAGDVHESKSEKAEILHENESELAERVARELLEGLRRASWVR